MTEAPQLGHNCDGGATSIETRGGEGDLGARGVSCSCSSSELRLLVGDGAWTDDVKDAGEDGEEQLSVSESKSSIGTEDV